MKRVGTLLLFLLYICFVFASVNTGGYDAQKDYVYGDSIAGSVNVSIKDEYYDENIVLSNGDNVKLGDFLEDNGAFFKCSPSDCSSTYEALGGDVEQTVDVSEFHDGLVGFVLKGGEIVLGNLSFNISSDFSSGAELPLVIKFFGGESWLFNDFSENFLDVNWGCFNSTKKEVGPAIGNSYYCEMIDIGDTPSLRVGADVSGGGSELLNMAIYPESGFGELGSCSFDPNTENSCVIDSEKDDLFYAGRYQVCVSGDGSLEYNIYQDSSGDSCGFAYDDGPASSVKDYGIFAQGLAYSSAWFLQSPEFKKSYIDSANSVIVEKYGGNCSEGCVLPLEISGVDQNFKISGVDLVYTDNSEWKENNLVYELEEAPAMVSFNGTLDLGLLNMSVLEGGKYFAKIGDEVLFEANVSLLPAPIITSVSPLSVPAGVPVFFHAEINFSGNDTVSYEWDFGDGAKANTNVPHVEHAYDDLKNYTLSLKASAGGFNSEKSFVVDAVNPEDAVRVGISSKKASLNSVREAVDGISGWYSDALLKFLGIADFEDSLKRLDKAQNDSFDAADFRDVAVEVYGLNIPVSIKSDNSKGIFFVTDKENINIEPVMSVAGSVTGAVNSDYVDPILVWQDNNIDISWNVKQISALYSYSFKDMKGIMSVYNLNLTSKADEEGYLVIDKPIGDLYFEGSPGARKSGDYTVLEIGPGESKKLDFYYKGVEPVGFFVSPRLSSLVIGETISEECNYNEVCEKNLGENSDNCRSDCKPFGRAIVYVVIVILFVFGLYTGLQIWYKKHYENYLFKDRVQLYNLLMYIANARARGMTDKDIVKGLKSKGWSSERVDYIIKKSLGKTVGMIEIIPIEKISAWIRSIKAKNAAKKKVVSTNRQQKDSNINKSGARGFK